MKLLLLLSLAAMAACATANQCRNEIDYVQCQRMASESLDKCPKDDTRWCLDEYIFLMKGCAGVYEITTGLK